MGAWMLNKPYRIELWWKSQLAGFRRGCGISNTRDLFLGEAMLTCGAQTTVAKNDFAQNTPKDKNPIVDGIFDKTPCLWTLTGVTPSILLKKLLFSHWACLCAAGFVIHGLLAIVCYCSWLLLVVGAAMETSCCLLLVQLSFLAFLLAIIPDLQTLYQPVVGWWLVRWWSFPKKQPITMVITNNWKGKTTYIWSHLTI